VTTRRSRVWGVASTKSSSARSVADGRPAVRVVFTDRSISAVARRGEEVNGTDPALFALLLVLPRFLAAAMGLFIGTVRPAEG